MNRALRVALVCPYSLSRPGGVQGQVVGLARALREAGHETVVLAPVDGPLEVPGLEPEDLVTLGRSIPVPANGSVAPISLSPSSVIRAVRAVRERGFDIVHLHEPLAPGPGYGCLLAGGEPKVGTFHRSGTGLAYRAFGPLARAAARRLDVRCAVSPEAMATASEVLGGSYELVGNGVDTDRFARAKPWPTTGPTVLFVGRHEKRKGLEVLLEAWDVLSASGGAAGTGGGAGPGTLWVTGVGPETEVLRRRHPERPNLEWLGRVDDDELASRLAGAHLLCAPSLGGESFGVVLVEAMAARTAVIASDIPGYAFAAGELALLVAPGDIGALTDALSRGLSDASSGSGICAPVALDGALSQARKWSMQALSSRYEDIYRSLVD